MIALGATIIIPKLIQSMLAWEGHTILARIEAIWQEWASDNMELHLLWVNWDNRIQQLLEAYFLDIEAIVEIQMDIMQGYEVFAMDVMREVHFFVSMWN